jgi:transposase
MDKITRGLPARVGVDLSKHVIQVHAVDAQARMITNRALSRDKFVPWCAQLPPGCLVVMEVSSSAHHWARKLLAMGLDARIVSAHLACALPQRRPSRQERRQ